ncbi:MAG: helix-turn-helix domain-containing protein [Candidatus Binatia bacterium]
MPRRKVQVEEGSGNVFADIGVKNPEEALLKAQLVRRITGLLDARGLTQVRAAKILGIDQLRPVGAKPPLVKRDGWWVHQGVADSPERLEDAVERQRSDRLARLSR